MNIIVAPDSFKECLSAFDVADIICNTLMSAGHFIIKIPLSDGGEGFKEAMNYHFGAKTIRIPAHDALMRPIFCNALRLENNTTVIETADTIGLTLIERDKRNPLYTTSYGTGEQIAFLLKKGCKDFIIALGGSATNDCGAGLMQALGFQFFDKNGKAFPAGIQGKDLIDIEKIEPSIINANFTLAVDVCNPLLGENGAARVYAPQKGADLKAVSLLEKGTAHFCSLVEQLAGKKIACVEGMGAAGGLGLLLYAFCDASLKSGIDLVMDNSPFQKALKHADLIITGEGKIDRQTVFGKVVSGVVRKSGNIPVVALCGCIGEGVENVYRTGIKKIYPVTPENTPFSIAKEKAPTYIKEALKKVLEDFKDLDKAS